MFNYRNMFQFNSLQLSSNKFKKLYVISLPPLPLHFPIQASRGFPSKIILYLRTKERHDSSEPTTYIEMKKYLQVPIGATGLRKQRFQNSRPGN